MKTLGVLGILMLGWGLSSCTKTYNFRTEEAVKIKMDELPADFKIPAKIWDLMEKADGASGGGGHEKKKEEGKEEGGKEGGAKEEGSSDAAIAYTDLKVFFTEKNEHILRKPAYEVELPHGGGSIDLANYLTGDNGTFFVGFELPAEYSEGKNFKAFYVSQGRKRKIEDRIFGGGCTQFYDITAKFTQMMKTEGIKANTTRMRHASLLAGHYIFSAVKDGQIYITQATITDSRYKNLLCEAL